jgi:DNA repair protein RecN (Recombination protein N)
VRYQGEATTLSAARRKAATSFSAALERVLADLAMEQTRFEVRFAEGEVASARGFDSAEFFLSPNPGEDLRPLARIVSGGELSRIMLALKTLASASAPGKTLIFDEVDAGIGGRVADVVGRNLQGLASEFQVLCITHLPQIAAYATTHFQIEKQVRRGRTVTSVVHLDDDGRAAEVARMMAGETSASSIAGAQALLARGRAVQAVGESERAKAKVRDSKAKSTNTGLPIAKRRRGTG